jgi:hypothetical protein
MTELCKRLKQPKFEEPKVDAVPVYTFLVALVPSNLPIPSLSQYLMVIFALKSATNPLLSDLRLPFSKSQTYASIRGDEPEMILALDFRSE